MYTPAALDSAPAPSPATPATSTASREGEAAATPTISEATETIPSFAPSTAARSQPVRLTKWGSSGCALCGVGARLAAHFLWTACGWTVDSL